MSISKKQEKLIDTALAVLALAVVQGVEYSLLENQTDEQQLRTTTKMGNIPELLRPQLLSIMLHYSTHLLWLNITNFIFHLQKN